MDCSYIQNNLFAMHEGLLPGDKMTEYEEHVRGCRHCGQIVSGFREMTAVIEDKKSAEPIAFSSTRIISFLESQLEKTEVKSRSGLLRVLQPVVVTFLLLAGIMIGFFVVQQKALKYSEYQDRQEEIRAMKSDLGITEFVEEDKSLFDNH
jgi:hypothetical protein